MPSDYTQDVEFNSAFDAFQAPVHMFTAAAICGASPPRIDRPFRYLDLACGNGLTLALLAAAYPHAEFVGIDINSDHIARAQRRAESASLTNATYVVGDLLDLDGDRFEPFDYVAVSGVYSWIDPVRRERTRKFVGQVTRTGGLIYLDYSSQPGMAQTAPLYRLLRDLGASFTGSSAEKLSAASRFADKMRKDGARFFQGNPIAAARLEAICQNPPEDEAHEVFNLQEAGFWSSEVIGDMAQEGCDFLASAGLHQNLPLLTARPDAMDAFRDLPVAMQQTCFDVTWNVHQRRDIFAKRAEQAPGRNLREILEDLPYYVMPGALDLNHRAAIGKQLPHFDFTSTEASRFADIASQHTTFQDLFGGLVAQGVEDGPAIDLVRHFLGARLISIAAAKPASIAEAASFEMASQLNRNILVEDIASQFPRPFASAVAGSRVLLPLKDRLYLWRLLDLDLEEAWAQLSDLQSMFRDNRNNPLDLAGFVETIEASLPKFKAHILPELLRLRICRTAVNGD